MTQGRGIYIQSACIWAARYNTWLLIKLTPKGVVFSFLQNACGIYIQGACGIYIQGACSSYKVQFPPSKLPAEHAGSNSNNQQGGSKSVELPLTHAAVAMATGTLMQLCLDNL